MSAATEVLVTRAECNEADCTARAEALGLCTKHYDRARKRGQHRHRDYDGNKAVQQRARNRATAKLVKNHQAEFVLLMQAEVAVAEAELAALEAIPAPPAPEGTAPTPSKGVRRLLPGPRPVEQTIVDRLRTDVGECASCHTIHDRGHECPACGADIGVTSLAWPAGSVPQATLADLVCTVPGCGVDGTRRGVRCTDGRTRHNYVRREQTAGAA